MRERESEREREGEMLISVGTELSDTSSNPRRG